MYVIPTNAMSDDVLHVTMRRTNKLSKKSYKRFIVFGKKKATIT